MGLEHPEEKDMEIIVDEKLHRTHPRALAAQKPPLPRPIPGSMGNR